MKGFVIKLLIYSIILFIAHHLIVYIHEWTHGFVAWIAGYKNTPFHIHYGEQWLTLWDINEAVNYPKIYADGKAYIVAWIAIAPIVLQIILFRIGLKVLEFPRVKKRFWLFAFFYLITLLLLAETYAYIPIRTFSGSEDIFNFITATGLSPWTIAIPGTLYVIWGAYQIFKRQISQAYTSLNMNTRSERFIFKLGTLLILLGYYGGVGFTKPDAISQLLSQISWIILLISMIIIFFAEFRYSSRRPRSDIKKSL